MFGRVNVKGKVVPVLKKYHAMKRYPVLN